MSEMGHKPDIVNDILANKNPGKSAPGLYCLDSECVDHLRLKGKWNFDHCFELFIVDDVR
jgi:hypothetical protein